MFLTSFQIQTILMKCCTEEILLPHKLNKLEGPLVSRVHLNSMNTNVQENPSKDKNRLFEKLEG